MTYRLQMYLVLSNEKDEEKNRVHYYTTNVSKVIKAIQKDYRVFKFPFPGMTEITNFDVKFMEEEIEKLDEDTEEEKEEDL